MNDTGIGARIPRKEDRRFITGKAVAFSMLTCLVSLLFTDVFLASV